MTHNIYYQIFIEGIESNQPIASEIGHTLVNFQGGTATATTIVIAASESDGQRDSEYDENNENDLEHDAIDLISILIGFVDGDSEDVSVDDKDSETETEDVSHDDKERDDSAMELLRQLRDGSLTVEDAEIEEFDIYMRDNMFTDVAFVEELRDHDIGYVMAYSFGE
eukprot:325517_1